VFLGLWLFLVIFLLAALALVGCSAKNAQEPTTDPALRALGQASMRVMAERLESPLGEAERAARGGPLGRIYHLEGRFQGRVSEALLAISASLGYGLSLGGPKGGDLMVVLEPKPEGATVFSLVKDLNRQLRPFDAYIGVDAINRRFVLTSVGGPR
jgi:hypothetical protein